MGANGTDDGSGPGVRAKKTRGEGRSPGDFPPAGLRATYFAAVVSAMWLMVSDIIEEPVSAGIVDVSAGGVEVSVCSVFWPQPIAARPIVSDSTATIARAKNFRIFTIHLLSDHRVRVVVRGPN
jgi:hypothetical protein